MGRTPFAGVAWQVLHYLEGLRRLGHDVYYVEDTGEWPYDPKQNTISGDPSYTVTYIARLMARIGFDHRWAYVSAADGRVYGLTAGEIARLFGGADALINLTGATVLRAEHCRIPIRIYLETDPVLPQIEVAQGNRFTIDLLRAHTHHFSFGENLGTEDCLVPVGPFAYQPTRQPVVIEWWAGAAERAVDTVGPFTTIANWRQEGKDIQWGGEAYFWSKHLEFLRFVDLPCRAGQTLELALACDDEEVLSMLRGHGWRVADALSLSRDVTPYQEYIMGSRAEFTVAKDQNIRLRSGWFSDRSACYLASGRPVVTQDTGFACTLPVGEGLFPFRTMSEILEAFDRINADYTKHSRSARVIAEQYFRAETVLAAMLSQAGL